MPDLDPDQIAAFDRDGYLVHTSSPNDSGAPRRVMIYSHYPKTAALGFDIRNGPNRLHESPWEWRYQRMKAAGEFVDSFRAS